MCWIVYQLKEQVAWKLYFRCIGCCRIAKACVSADDRLKECIRSGAEGHISKDYGADRKFLLCKGKESVGTLQVAAGLRNTGDAQRKLQMRLIEINPSHCQAAQGLLY